MFDRKPLRHECTVGDADYKDSRGVPRVFGNEMFEHPNHKIDIICHRILHDVLPNLTSVVPMPVEPNRIHNEKRRFLGEIRPTGFGHGRSIASPTVQTDHERALLFDLSDCCGDMETVATFHAPVIHPEKFAGRVGTLAKSGGNEQGKEEG